MPTICPAQKVNVALVHSLKSFFVLQWHATAYSYQIFIGITVRMAIKADRKKERKFDYDKLARCSRLN